MEGIESMVEGSCALGWGEEKIRGGVLVFQLTVLSTCSVMVESTCRALRVLIVLRTKEARYNSIEFGSNYPNPRCETLPHIGVYE